jgi:hypothetical protein
LSKINPEKGAGFFPAVVASSIKIKVVKAITEAEKAEQVIDERVNGFRVKKLLDGVMNDGQILRQR